MSKCDIEFVARTPFVAEIPVPAIPVTISAIVSFLEVLSVASMIATLSFATSTAAAVNSFRSRDTTPLEWARPSPATEELSDTVTSPEVPPPDKPSPATTLVTSPTCPLIVNVPALSSYVVEIPVPATNSALTLSSTFSLKSLPSAAV